MELGLVSQAPEHAAPPTLRVAEIVCALSQALDLGSGSSHWHSVRTCILGMRIADELRLAPQEKNYLYYALLLKDAGWTVNSTEENRKDVSAIRSERGGTLARLMRLPEETAHDIACIPERWNGHGNVHGLAREEIPVASRIILAAQNLDMFFTAFGPEVAIRVLSQNSEIWFDPAVVKAARSLDRRKRLWNEFQNPNLLDLAICLEPNPITVSDSPVTLEAICQAFATIVDAKSPFTFYHSNGVANAAVAIAKKLGLPNSRAIFVRHAALLHDIGKMAIPNEILQKSTELTPAEWKTVRAHPAHTFRILNPVRGFGELSEVAASHHERLDGSGYYRGLTADRLSMEARILIVADVFDALMAKRPYREGVPRELVLHILRSKTPDQFDSDCVAALESTGIGGDQTFIDLDTVQAQLGAVAGRWR